MYILVILVLMCIIGFLGLIVNAFFTSSYVFTIFVASVRSFNNFGMFVLFKFVIICVMFFLFVNGV